MIFQKITAIIAEHTGGDPASITMETTFEELGLDSLDSVDIVMALETELEVELEMEGQFVTVSDLVTFVEGKVNV